MPTVCFLIPASPNSEFFSQVAAFSAALSRLHWSRWEPTVTVCLGEDLDVGALQRWLPHLKDVALTLVPPVITERNSFYYGQIDSLYRWAPRGSDVLVRMDADTLPVGDLEDVLDMVVATASIAGVVAHFPFPGTLGLSARESWHRVSKGLIDQPLDFRLSYSLVRHEAHPDDCSSPFYVNDGAVFFARQVFDEFSRHYLAIRPRLMERLSAPYFAGQVALTLAATEMGARTVALPMRYNFPNDAKAVSRFPEELEEVRIFHYLRTDTFGRQEIFRDRAGYDRFMRMPMDGANAVFRQHVATQLGEAYPFPDRGAETAADTGRPATVGATPGSSAHGGLDEAMSLATSYRTSNRLDTLMRIKQVLCLTCGVAEGFEHYREFALVPDSETLQQKAIAGMREAARASGSSYFELDPGGVPFTVPAPRVVGDAQARDLQHVSRAMYVASLDNVRVRGRSLVVETASHALLDFEDWEAELFDCELDIDPSIFCVEGSQGWIPAPDQLPPTMEVDEAYSVLGPQTGAFGDWMYTMLPRYVYADMSGRLPIVPVLVDKGLPSTVLDSLRMVLRPGVELIEVPPFRSVNVRRLWLSPSLHYAPSREVMDGRYKFDYSTPVPSAFLRVVREIRRRASTEVLSDSTDRIFLARKPSRWRKMVNHEEIEGLAAKMGFSIVYPETLDFASQVALVRAARWVIAPEGSAIMLMYFARPGTSLCILNHPIVETTAYDGLLDGVDLQVLVGPIVDRDPAFPHRSSYHIDPGSFDSWLRDWVGGSQ